MPVTTDLIIRPRVSVSIDQDRRIVRVTVRQEGESDYGLVVDVDHARAIVNSLADAIAANPDLFPLTHVRRLL